MPLSMSAQDLPLPGVEGDLTICAGTTTTITATSSDSTATFRWYDALVGGNLLSSQAAFSTPLLSASASYFVEQNASGQMSARRRVEVLVTSVPQSTMPLNVVASPSWICQDSSSRLSAEVDEAAGQWVYWYDAPVDGNLLSQNRSGTPFEVAPQQTTTYYAQSVTKVDTATFSFTGAPQMWIVPDGVTEVDVDAYGARGGHSTCCSPSYAIIDAGKGGRVEGILKVNPGDTLWMYVGGAGTNSPNHYITDPFYAGGWNGGGNGGSRGGGGGGATDIRLGGTSLEDRILVAGGGGGATKISSPHNFDDYRGGAGGGLIGGSSPDNYFGHATGGSQVSGGRGIGYSPFFSEDGRFGQGGNKVNTYSGAGGGGGWYGGAGSFTVGAGGGSSYTDTALVYGVNHEQGVWNDHGKLILYYYTNANCHQDSTRVPVTVTVYETPHIDAGPNLITCLGTPIELSAMGADTYLWTPGDLTGNTVTVNPAETTTFTVTGQKINPEGACPSLPDQVTVSVKEVSAGSDKIICRGQSVTLSASGADNYHWLATGETTTSILVSPDETTSYVVEGINESGCSTFDTVIVEILDIPATNAGADLTIFAGDSLTLQASGADTYQWSPGGVITSQYRVGPAASQTFSVTGTLTSTGCTISDQVLVTILPLPDVTGQTTVLQGNSTTLMVQSPVGETFYWYDADQTTLLATGDSITTDPLQDNTTLYVGYEHPDAPDKLKPVHLTVVAPPTEILVESGGDCPDATTQLYVEPSLGTTAWYGDAGFTEFLGYGDTLSVQSFETKTYFVRKEIQPDTIVFDYTGAPQMWVVPPGLFSLEADAYGARGGHSTCCSPSYAIIDAGRGGQVSGELNVQPGDTLWMYVGGAGTNSPNHYITDPVYAGGWNGGGNGGSRGGGGGGATDIRLGGTSLEDRILVAGGGGGATKISSPHNFDDYRGGAGGGLIGGSSPDNYFGHATGGTQISGGRGIGYSPFFSENGRFGQGGNKVNTYSGAGGGGGWYGGAGSFTVGAGGGSSYTDPKLVHDVIHQQGVHNAAGQLILRYGTTGHTQAINITIAGNTDSEAPVARARNTTIYLNELLTVTIQAEDLDDGSSDNCSIVSRSLDRTTFTCADIGDQTVTLTVTDQSGNSAQVTATVFVVDSVPPVASVRDTVLYLNEHGQAFLSADEVDNGSTDNCFSVITPGVGELFFSLEQTDFGASDVGVQSVHFIVFDAYGNYDEATVQVDVRDTIPPVANCQPTTVFLDDQGMASVLPGQIDDGSTDQAGIADLSIARDPGLMGVPDFGESLDLTCEDLDTSISVLLKVMDVGGNTANCQTTIALRDTIFPDLACHPYTVYLNGSGTATAAPTDFVMESTDACGIASLSLNIDSYSCADIGNQPVTITAIDIAGNSVICQTTVTVLDTLPPVVVCQDATVYVGGDFILDWYPPAIDNGTYDNCGSLELRLDKYFVPCFETGDHLVTLTATDDSGNSASCTSTVTALDTTAPTVTCTDVTIYLDATGQAVLGNPSLYGFGYDDNCGYSDTTMLDQTHFGCGDLGQNTITFTGVDQAGNSASCTSTVTVLDTITPEVECRDVQVYLDEDGQGELSTTQVLVQTMDNCTTDTTYLDHSVFSCGDIGSHTVTLTAEFAGGNTASCTSTVTVLDTLPPVVVCQDATVYVGGDFTLDWQPTAIDNGTYDNCGSLELSLDKYFVPCFETGDHLVTLTATDDSGNSASCTSTVTALDTTAPTVTCTDVTLYLDATGQAVLGDPFLYEFGYDDNCGYPDTTMFDRTHFDCGDVGQNTITFTGVDQAGNTASCTSTITVVDTIPPTEQCEDITVYLDQNGQFELSPVHLTEFPQDACGVDTIFLDKTLFTCADVGEQDLTITARDVNGNETSCTSTVTVLDTIAPLNLWEEQTIYLDATGTWELSTVQIDPLPWDACGIDTVFFDRYLFTCADVGEQDLTITAIDVYGNQVTYTRPITVLDTISPALACRDITAYLDETGSYELSQEDILVSAEDACGVEEVTLSGITEFGCAMPPVTVSLEALDQNGNTSYCQSQITILDTIPPAQVCQDTTIYLDETGSHELRPADVLGNVWDACGIDTVGVHFPVEYMTCSSPDLEVDVFATDLSGNTTYCTSTISVSDTVAPLVRCQDVTVYLDRYGETSITPEQIDDGSTDACGISMLTLDQMDFTCSEVGAQTVILTATDQNGNTRSCQATVTVLDTLGPEVTATSFLYLDLLPDTAYLQPDQVIETVFEACGQDSVWLSKSLFTEQDTGLQWVQWYVRDIFGNTTTDSVQVQVVAPMVLTTNLTQESCFEANDGAVDLSVRSGVPPYRYAWSNGAETADLANLEAGMYRVTVTDARGHTATETVQITQPQLLILSISTQDASCFSESNGSISTTVQGGTGPYSYQWSTGAETSGLDSMPAGTYRLTVTDANQCTVFADTSIVEPADFSMVPVADVGPVCDGTPVRILFSSDEAEATFSWTNTNPAIGLPASGQGAIDFSANNETAYAQTGTMVVTPHYAGCSGNPDTFQITVACPSIAGQVRWHRTGAGLDGVVIDQMGDATQETQTNDGGVYELPAQPGVHFRHHPSFPELALTSEDLPIYGIDELDAQRLQEHLDGGTPLRGYELLAGDVNDNGQLSSADLVLMEYALRGFEEPLQFFEREAWKFVDAATQAVDSLMFAYSDTLIVNDRHGEVSGVSWLGVRKGDLTGSNGSLDYDPVIATSPLPLDPVDARTDAPGLSLAILSDQMTATCGDVFEAVVIAQDVSGGDSISLLTLDAGVHWAADELLLLEATAGQFRGGEANVFTTAAMGQVSLAWKDLVNGGVPVVQGDTLLTLTFEVLQTPGLSTLELGPTPGTQPAGALSYLVGFQYSENWESMPAQVEFVPETSDFELNRVSPYTVETIDVPNAVCVDATTVPVQVSFQQMAGEAPTHYSIDFFAEAESMGLFDITHLPFPANGLIDLLLPTDLPEGTIAFELSVGDGGDCYSEPLAASLDVVAAPEVLLTGLPDIICPETAINVEALMDQPEQYGYAWQICSENGDNCQSLNGSTAQVSFAVAEPGDYELVLIVSGGDCGDLTVRKSFSVQQLPVVTYPLEEDELVYCQGTEVYLAFTANQLGTSFQWVNTNTGIGLAASGTGPLRFTATNAGTTTVTVTPVINGCEGNPITFTLQVQAGTSEPVSLALNQDTVCLADAAQMVTTMPVGGILSGPGTSSTPDFFTPSEAGAGTHILAYTYGDEGCSSTAIDTVVVLPAPVADLPEDTMVCTGSPATLSVTGTPNTTVWYRENGTEKSLLLDGSGHGTLNWPGLAESIQIQWDSIGFVGSVRCVELLDESTTVEVAPEISVPTFEVMGPTCPGESPMVQLSGEAVLEVVYRIVGEEPDSLILPTDGDTILTLGGLTETSSMDLLRVRRSGVEECTLDLSEESIELPVWETPQLANVPNTFLCSGETFELNLPSLVLNEVPVSFSWEVLAETNMSGASNGSGTRIEQTLENTTGETISLVYRVQVTPQEGDCAGQILLVPVQVFSEPVSMLSVLDQTICPADTMQPINIAVTNGMTTQTNLSWERDGLTEVSGVINGTGNQISGLLTNLTQTDQTITYSVYQEATNGCAGDTLTSTVHLPVDETAPVAVCPPVVRVAVNQVSGVRMYGREIDAGSTDNCGIYEYGLSMDSVGWNERGTHEVTLTVRDASGNSDNCTFRLEVTEEQACRAQLNVVLDEQGRYELTPAQVITGAVAPGLRIQVDDARPGNGAIVDCPGEYRYAIFDERDVLVCWGYVLAEDKSAPTVVGLTGKKDSLICTYVDQLANNQATVDPADRYYLGHVTFTDNTITCADCTLPEVTFTDRVEYLDCPDDLTFGAEYVYARMYRTFVQKDCYGNEQDTTVTYTFLRPATSDFHTRRSLHRPPKLRVGGGAGGPISLAAGASAEESDFEIFSCNPDTITIPDTLGLPYLISAFGDTLTLADVDCQYAWSVEDQTFPICEGRGLKVERTIRVMDWCAEASGTPFDTVLIKIGDFEAPQLHGPITDLRLSPYSDPLDFLAWYDTVYLQQEIVPGLDTWQELVDYAREQGTLSIISTGPADCTGALLLEQDWIEQQFGVSVSDNCELREAGYELLQYGPENKGQEITGNYHWQSSNYQLQGNAITGLPTGIYALAITGRDYCGLSSTGLIIFTVEDQIAPVMTCDDQVTVTLSQEGLAKIEPADLEEGSWDNCGTVSLALRQKNTDTIWQQELWLDCSQVGGPIVVEVQGIDAAGNTNTCWTEVVVEDKTAPLCTDLTPLTLSCDDPGLEDFRSLGLPETPFSNCGNIEILELEAITNLDQCGVGTITRQFVAVKDQGAETEQRSEICEQLIEVVSHHDYWLMFPADQTAVCGEDVSIRGVAFAENACDLIAISHTDERFYATQDPEACYKIFRTYRVINWCEYDGESAPTIVSRDWDGWNGENPRHPDGDDVPGDEDMYVIVKRNLADGHPDTVFYDNNPYPYDGSIQQDGITYDHWWAVLSGNNDPSTEDYYEGIPEHIPGCTDCRSTWSYDGDQTDSDISGNVQGDDTDFRYGSFGYWQYTQHIIVYDTIAPALTINGVDSFCSISDEDCSAPVELTIAATDLCTDDQGDVTVTVELDMHNDGTTDQDVTEHFDPVTGLFTGRYPLGEHRLLVTVHDGCGNQTSGNYVFTVVDCKAPAPIVIDALSVELMPSESDPTGAAAVVWASDFVASAIYDCSGQDPTQTDANGNPLVTQYSINRVGEMPDPTQDYLFVNCSEAVQTLEVEIHAWDEAGNHDFATTFLLVQDNMGLCDEPVDGDGGITGAIATEQNVPVPNVEVRLSGSAQRSFLTDQRGGYSLFGLEEGGDYTVTPSLNDDPLNGVSTFDLVLISKHILGLQPFESPYQQIAADINRSGTVTTLDLIQLRKLILHIDAEFSNNTSWRFVDADYGFRQNSNPLDQPFPEVKNINNLEGEEVAEFVAIKVGDVNGNANVAELRSYSGTFKLNVAEQALKAGKEYRIPVTTEQLAQIEGYQFTLEVDPAKVDIVDLEYGVAAEEHFGVFVDKGIITSSFNQPNSTFNIEHSSLFTLVLRPTVDTKVSDVLRITSRFTTAEAYGMNGDLLSVRLSVEDGASSAGNELYQNSPNPFQSETRIGFFLAKAEKATLTIRDIHGRTVYTASGTYGAGYQQVRIREQDLGVPGVYTYTLETGAESKTRKMVLGIR